MIDHSIIRGCLQKDKKSEYLLYKQSFSLLMKVCYRYTSNKDDAMDFVNRGFLKILNNLDKYDFQHPYEAWIRRIMVNRFFMTNSYHDIINKNVNCNKFFYNIIQVI